MTRQQQYDLIIARMHLPESYEKYDDSNVPTDHDVEDTLIRMHLKHIRDYLGFLSSEDSKKSSDVERKFIETSCDAAIHAVEKLLEKKGWK